MAERDFWKGMAAGVCSAALIAGSAFGGWQLAQSRAEKTVLSDKDHVRKLEYLERLIDETYLEAKDEEDLAEGLYTGLLYGLGDPYSRYYTAEEYEEESALNEGEYKGIGVQIYINEEGYAQLAGVYEGSTGEAAGLQEGDVILAVQGESVQGLEGAEVSEKIHAAGDQVVLTISREGEQGSLDVAVEIGQIRIPSVSGCMLPDGIGYLRILEFSGVTSDQYAQTFAQLEEEGMEKLVVDLRDNPGGTLTGVCDVLRQILPEGLIVYTQDKDGNREEEWCEGDKTLTIPLAVLVNGGSASASEVFAGAVQDYGMGTLVGTTTYGKGIVQTLRTLTDGSAIKLTTARYYTPQGNNIHGTGIRPDVFVEDTPGYPAGKEPDPDQDGQLSEAVHLLTAAP